MPTKACIERAQKLRPAIIACFVECGTVLQVARRLGLSQGVVKKTLDEAGIATPKKGDVTNWKGGEAGKDAGRVRARRQYRLGQCEECGAIATERHHRDGNTLNNARDNVAIVCRRCHMRLDGRLEKFRALPRKGKRPQGTTCKICGRSFWPLRKGRCGRCALYFYAHGTERPLAPRVITHCPRGHEYTLENTRIDRNGCKTCRACRRNKERERRRLAKAIIAGETEDPRGNL